VNGKPSKPHASALLVAIGHYDSPAYEPLNEAPKAAQELADVLKKGGYTHVHPELLDGGDSPTIFSTLGKWLRAADKGGIVVVYWTGHGKPEGDGHFLITKNSPLNNFAGDNALRTSELGSLAAKSPAEKVLILLDTCYSGAGAGEIANIARTVLATRPAQPGRSLALAVIASAHPLKKAKEAVFCRALTKVLSQPPAIGWAWTDNDEFIHASDLAEAVETALGEQVYCEMSGSRQRFIPNPRYRGELPAEDVESRRRRLEAAEEHFVPASRGIEIGKQAGTSVDGPVF
jgi:Caspase domain